MKIHIRALLALALVLLLTAVSTRYFPTTTDSYSAIAHYAVAIRKRSFCDQEPSFSESLRANSAYAFLVWNKSGYDRYVEESKSLLHFSVGKVKCLESHVQFEQESHRTIRAINLTLSRGEDVNSYNVLGVTALHTAALSGNQNIVQHLLSVGASPHAKTLGSFFWDEGETPLELATSAYEMNPDFGHFEVIRLLEAESG